MNVTLYNDENLLPKALGAHVFVYTGQDLKLERQSAGTVTEIYCSIIVNGNEVLFRKNTESVHLRFEDAVLWAVRYARTFEIAEVHAVFKLTRAIDTRFIRKMGSVNLINKSGQALSIEQPKSERRHALSIESTCRTMRGRRSLLQRYAVLRGKLDRYRDYRRNQNFNTQR